jgi:hypothetical protein
MNPKIYSNVNNYLIIYIPKVIPWGQMDKQTNKRMDGRTDGRANIYSIFRDKLSLPQGSLDHSKIEYFVDTATTNPASGSLLRQGHATPLSVRWPLACQRPEGAITTSQDKINKIMLVNLCGWEFLRGCHRQMVYQAKEEKQINVVLFVA